MSAKPTSRQVLGAKVRAEEERWTKKHRKPYEKGGGWLVPPRSERDAHLAKTFGLLPQEVSQFLTYSRYCTHPWSDGACTQCPH